MARADTGPDGAELDALLADLASRRFRAGGRRSLRRAAWKATVRASYAVKRLVDFAGAGVGLVLLLPVFLAIAVAVKRSGPGPVFFSQIRVGLDGRFFRFWKFRTMRQDAEALKASLAAKNESADGVIFKMKDDPRITKVGRFLRRTSLDELPQLWNVFVGDMSLVGPRPPVPSEVALYTLEDRKRLHVKPGLTCLWQIEGRSDLPFRDQVRLDKEYIRSQSLWRDLLILLRTIPAVIGGKGAY